ncbi:ABC transporter ATP-binding protein [Streptococcus cuniculi]|uniref:ABC transporter ATP-binding protein n=1 Tax=Streptococcus cuniculi TaxID=1432788 RepID=A0A4Y9JCV1_9STRE|nr:dipeptide/oligopeptide/nickel ABC transporter ATP-binding protein [Streptococcus cuniculi]MBF0777617.1 ABC transporter ATP-binding protein [Streptococcus cuniculi]TFU98657.1 ABC transporter ATP-binding protein [Streptococcus cuniculi]
MKIECRHVSKQFDTKPVLQNCHFSVKQGEIVGIMGESGTGKSTLAKLLVGLEQASAGEILLDGKPYHGKDGARILLVFQDALHAVNPLFSVKDILTEATKDAVSVEEIVAILKEVGLDETYLTKKPRQLSGGQLQRICIARALLLQPDVIIFDEALSGLDPLIQGQLLRLLYQLKIKHQQTYIFISHDFNLCYALCHRILVMFDGQIVDEITDFSDPIEVNHPATQNLLTQSQNPKHPKCRIRKMMATIQQTHEGEQK